MSLVLHSAEILTLTYNTGKSLNLSVSTSPCVRVVCIVGEVRELTPLKVLEDGVLWTSLFSVV